MTPVCFVPVVSPDRLACHLGQRRIVLIEQESYRKIVDNSDLSFGRLRWAGATRVGRRRDYHLLTERGLKTRIIYTILYGGSGIESSRGMTYSRDGFGLGALSVERRYAVRPVLIDILKGSNRHSVGRFHKL